MQPPGPVIVPEMMVGVARVNPQRWCRGTHNAFPFVNASGVFQKQKTPAAYQAASCLHGVFVRGTCPAHRKAITLIAIQGTLAFSVARLPDPSGPFLMRDQFLTGGGGTQV